MHLTPEQEARLTQAASDAGTDAAGFVKDAVLRLIESKPGLQPAPPGSVLAAMRTLRARVKPDPEGRTTRDYVRYGRR